jgi:hypothetical protein
MKKLLFSAAIMMIVTSPALAGGLGGGGIGDCKGCNSSALQEIWGPPVPPAAHPRGYPYSPGYNYSYGYSPNQGGGEVGYCMRRFRSYDPRSGTYLGFDGLRHPCK